MQPWTQSRGSPAFVGHSQPVCVWGQVEVERERLELSVHRRGQHSSKAGEFTSPVEARGGLCRSGQRAGESRCLGPSTLGMWLPALTLLLQPEGSLGDLTLQLLWLPRLHLKEPSYSLPLSRAWPEQNRQPLPPRVWLPTPTPRLPSLGVCSSLSIQLG